ncbi:MAG: helix-turn-helix domain-containing protein [Clostridiales bacterium]|nr:helix-turn-helix domain-containing protein [Clostridiales bacterium]
MIRKFNHITDYLMTEEMARERLCADQVDVTWYTNKTNTESVLHSHPYYEAILPISGEVLYSVNGSLYHLHTGELIIFPDEVFHSGKFDVGADVSERLLLKVDEGLWRSTAEALGFPDILSAKEPIIFTSETVSAWDIRGLITRINRTSTMHKDYRTTMLQAQLAELMMIILQIEHDDNQVRPNATSALVEKAVKYIQANYSDPDLTVGKLAEYTFVSRSHLSRVFKEYTMESVHSYVTNLRMQHCQFAIAEGKTVLDACTESGFSDYSSFLKAFRKRYGITPIEYKKRIAKATDGGSSFESMAFAADTAAAEDAIAKE